MFGEGATQDQASARGVETRGDVLFICTGLVETVLQRARSEDGMVPGEPNVCEICLGRAARFFGGVKLPYLSHSHPNWDTR